MMRILSPEIVDAVTAYLNSPSPAALSALTRGFQGNIDPRSLAYLAEHFRALLRAASAAK